MNDQARAIMRSLPDLVPPKLNLNGTSKEELLFSYTVVLRTLREVDKAMADATPHGRDYQTHSNPDAAINARRAWNVRRALLKLISDEIEHAAEMVAGQ